MKLGEAGRTNLAVVAAATAAVCLVLWAGEHRRRRNAEAHARAVLALGTALAETAPNELDRVRPAVLDLAESVREGRFRDATAQARSLTADLAAGRQVLVDESARRAARAFFKRHPDLGRRLLELTARGRAAEAEGRDSTGLKKALGGALDGACREDRAAVETLLEKADGVPLPFVPNGANASVLAVGGPAAEQARRALNECRYPAEIADELMLESSPAIQKIDMLARAALADGDGAQALWLAEMEARLLGLRDAAPVAGDLPPTVALPAADAPGVRRLLGTARTVIAGKSPFGASHQPAAQLVAEAEQALRARHVRRAGTLVRAALNVLGMNDETIAELAAGVGTGRPE